MNEKASYAFFETSGEAKIHRLPLQAFPNFWAYAYVIQKEDYCVLIDTGSGTDTSHENLVSGLQGAGLQPSDLTHILITHAHIDHFGGLTKLHPITGAQVGVHELDLQMVADHEARLALSGRRLAAFLGETGLEQEAREQILGIYRFSKTLCQSVPVDFTFEAAGLKFGPFEFIHLPGHCPGHVAIRLDEIVFCGDLVVEGVTPHLAPESIGSYGGLAHYLESLSHLKQWAKDARLILNGHNEAILDLPFQIQATKQNIFRRVNKAVEALIDALTVDEICRAVYGETGGYNQLLVIEKTGAYVEYLYERGMIEIVNPIEVEQGQPARYRRVQDEAAILDKLLRNMEMYTGTPEPR